MFKAGRRAGFTLVELLVVIAIIGILIALFRFISESTNLTILSYLGYINDGASIGEL